MTALRFADFPPLLQALLLIETASYDLAALLPVHLRGDIPNHLPTIADLLESPDPLVHRRRYNARFLDGPMTCITPFD